MSDFDYIEKCLGCRQQYAPDDGECCLRCECCDKYKHTVYYNEKSAALLCYECPPEEQSADCKFCDEVVWSEKVHLHNGNYVCNTCWDSRLRMTQ